MAAATWAAMYSRSSIGPLQETVRGSLELSDNEMALLQGAAMAVPMALGSIPLGLWADRFSRVRMLQFFVALTLAACLLSAWAPDFGFLFAARCLAGLSSAAILIASFSLVGDFYSSMERGRASTVVASGEIVGAPVSFALGGALLVSVGAPMQAPVTDFGLESWRAALIWMAAVLVPVFLLMLFLREPARTDVEVAKPPFLLACRKLWEYRGIAFPVLLARAMVWLADGAVFVWGAPNFARRFQLSPDRIGALMGTVLLVSGLLGPVLGGPLADFCQRRGGPRRTMLVLAGVALASVPAAFFALMPSVTSVTILLAVFLTLGFAVGTAGVTLSIIVIPGELRGFYLGMSFTVGSLFFVGLAPLIVSTLAGALGGEAMIGQALTIVCGSACLVGAAVFALSARHFPSHYK